MNLLTITDIAGNTEPLTGHTQLRRKRKVNGEKTISFTVIPTNENQYSFPMVQEESKVEFNGETYIIKQVKERSLGKLFIKQCEAIHSFYVDMINSHEYSTRNGSMPIISALDFVFSNTPYTVAIVDSFYAQDWESFGDDNKLSLFQKVLERYEAEFTVSGNRVTIRKKIGIDTDFQFRYNYNIKTLERNVDSKGLSTYIRGYGKGIEAEYTSPNASVLGIIHEKPVRDDRYTTSDGLMERLKKEIQDTPLVSITVDFVDMRRAGYPYDVPNEGDRVPLVYEPMSIDIDTRIMEVDEGFNEKLEVINSNVTLANYKKDFAGTLFQTVNKAMGGILNDDGKIKYNVLDDAVKLATEAIKSAQTELKFENGILAINPDNPNEIVVFNSAGIGISRDGGKTFQEALTYQGLVASVGIIGFISANHIRAGILASHEDTFKIDLDRSAIDFYSINKQIATTISQVRAGDRKEITTWAVESVANKEAALSFGKRNDNGSVTQSLYIDGEKGDLYSYAPAFYCHAEPNFLSTSYFKAPVRFEGAGKFETVISGNSWSITNETGFRESAAFNPHQSGSGSIGQAQQVWGEGFFYNLNAVNLNGTNVSDLINKINNFDSRLKSLEDWKSSSIPQ
ncbi:phage tail protein [Bacillus sp. BP-3]|uniref:phage tail protein n=1 Tax=Bacillus sp. BP-3 TaxID=3022773 RepID=UPI0023305AE2|nr:phage tail spike protein [Bacillus sp. BP-3]MDC2867557.1 phage tail protein [Bacillus sp. BP-3]